MFIKKSNDPHRYIYKTIECDPLGENPVFFSEIIIF